MAETRSTVITIPQQSEGEYLEERVMLGLLREYLREAAVIAGRLSEAVSDQRIPVVLASEVAATRNVIIGAQSCAAVLARQLEERAKAGK
jgi:hypothetical protein